MKTEAYSSRPEGRIPNSRLPLLLHRDAIPVGGVIAMPAGVSHEMVDCSEGILVVGGYPDGRDWDKIQKKLLTDELFRQAAKRITMLPVLPKNPVTGEALHQWLDAPSSVGGGWNDFRNELNATS